MQLDCFKPIDGVSCIPKVIRVEKEHEVGDDYFTNKIYNCEECACTDCRYYKEWYD